METAEDDELAEGVDRKYAIYRSYYGMPGLNINIAYVQAALALLVAGWYRLQAKGQVNAKMDEDPITYLLDDEMRVAQRTGISDIIRWVLQPNIRRDPINPLLRCEPDFIFLWEDEETDPDLCLYAEAKRLFGTGASLADKYVEQGLLDFVEARYGRSHNYGIMLGYVLKGPLQKAVTAVKTAMTRREKKTAQRSAFTPDTTLCSHPYTHHSSHLQRGATKPMVIVHLFMDFS